MAYRLILASQSPRRQALLREMGLVFTAQGANIQEDFPDTLPAHEVPVFLAQAKAAAMQARLTEQDLLITADTIVVLGNQIINKPLDKSDAVVMLQNLSGKPHFVYTGVCLQGLGKSETFVEKTTVHFRPLTLAQIQHYVDVYEPLDKAGAYGIQDWIGLIGVERIEGCFYNVMGLPTSRLYAELEKAGWLALVKS